MNFRGEFFGRNFWLIFLVNFLGNVLGNFFTYNLLTIASFRIGVPSILIQTVLLGIGIVLGLSKKSYLTCNGRLILAVYRELQ